MKRFLLTLILTSIIFVGGWAVYHRNEINNLGDVWRLASSQIGLHDPSQSDPPNAYPFQQASAAYPWADHAYHDSAINQSPVSMSSVSGISATQKVFNGQVIRIASFRIADGKALRPEQTALVAEICQHYDVVALQNSGQTNLVTNLIGQLNARGNEYVFVDRKDGLGTMAIVFDQRSLILDQQHWYTVNDPDDVMSSEPLVAWFRTRNAPPELAFTFTLVSMQLDKRRPDLELAYLGEVFRAIRDDGRGEDDVIIVGDFNAGDRGLRAIESKTGLKCLIVGTATNTLSNSQLDNILYNPQATIELTGNRGVFDFMRQYNMSLEDAMHVSSHMPVWAEFSIYEGHSPGRVTESAIVPKQR